MDGNPPLTQSKILRKPGSIEWNGTLPYNPGTPYRTLQKNRNSSSSSFANSQTSTLRRNKNDEVKPMNMDPSQTMASVPSNQATLRRPKTTERRGRMEESDHRQILRNLVRLSMAAFAENGSIELSSASPEVQVRELFYLFIIILTFQI